MTLLPDNLLPADWADVNGLRAEAIDAARQRPIPSAEEEDWRYSHIDELELDELRLTDGPVKPVSVAGEVLAALGDTEGVLALSADGSTWSGSPTVEVRHEEVGAAATDERFSTPQVEDPDAFTVLNLALAPEVHTLTVPARAQLERPLVVVNHGAADQGIAAQRVRVAVGEAAIATIVHLVASPPGDQVVVPVTELAAGPGAVVHLVTVHVLGDGCWAIGRIMTTAERDATVKLGSVSLGGNYSRLRLDATLAGDNTELVNRALYLGTGSSMHDYRVVQRHIGRHSTSKLTLRGAVRDEAEGVFTGVVRMEPGAKQAAGAQDARHLILEDGGHVDSVPNLEIEENDVTCSHASSISPVHADQVFYLESRGVPTSTAARLIARGFLRDAEAGVAPEGLATAVGDLLADALAPEFESPLIR